MSSVTSTSWRNALITPERPLREAIARIDEAGFQIAIVVDDEGRLVGVVTDGDVRRAVLKGLSLETPTSDVMNRNPKVESEDASTAELLALMRKTVLHQVPLLDAGRRVVGLATIDQLIGKAERPNWVVLMAGGRGTRLRPLTEKCPKPMLPVGGKPILQTVLEGFVEQGFRRFFISVNYMAHVIRAHFGDGSEWGVQIDYLVEDRQLGTAGALRLLPDAPEQPLLVMNGDLLTRLRFESMLRFHDEHSSSATMAVREYDFQVPYGVVCTNGTRIESIDEKPVHRFFVNAGIYVLSPEAIAEHVVDHSRLDMPELFERVIASGKTAAAYPLREYWLDVGRLEEFERAQREWSADEESEEPDDD